MIVTEKKHVVYINPELMEVEGNPESMTAFFQALLKMRGKKGPIRTHLPDFE